MALWKFNSTITAEGLNPQLAEDAILGGQDIANHIIAVGDIVVDGTMVTLNDNDVIVPALIIEDDILNLTVGIIDYATYDSTTLYYEENYGNNSIIIDNNLQNLTLNITSIGENVRPWLEANATCLEEAPTGEYLEITYNGKTYIITAGQKLTFKGGKTMQGDIVVKAIDNTTSNFVLSDGSIFVLSDGKIFIAKEN